MALPRNLSQKESVCPVKSLLSIVVPCYNEEEVLNETILRLYKTIEVLEQDDLDVELVFVDDGSKDGTRDILRRFSEADHRVCMIGFARNFGHQLAVSAGIDAARGNAVVLIDADLQDPPEIIVEMVKKWRGGFDVVYGTRTDRLGEAHFKVVTARIFYRVLNRLSDVPIPLDTGDFRLMDRKVVDVIKSMPEHDRFVRGMVSWVGFRQVSQPYQRDKRFAGESKYPLTKMLRFAFDGILSFSVKPLQFSIMLGILSSAFAMLVIIYSLILRLFTHAWVPGWTALIVAVLFLGGVQLICVGIIGEYVGRIYREVKQRPLYVVQERCGFEALDTESHT